MPTLSDAMKRIFASAPSDRRYLQTLELTHSQFPTIYRMVNDRVAWLLALDDGTTQALFQPVPFVIIPPSNDGKGQQDAQLTIDNVGREAVDAIEAAAVYPDEPVQLTYRLYLDVAYSAPQSVPPLVLSFQQIQVTSNAITGTATRADTLNREFPAVVYSTTLFPGLDR